MKPLVSVIVLNFNGKKYLEGCLSSLKAQTYPNFEVILVDNGSTDGSKGFIKEKYCDYVKLIENTANLGFAGGNDIGIEAAKGDFIATLNNDTKTDPRWIEELMEVALNDPSIGMWASRVMSMEDPNIIDSVGVSIYGDGMSRARGRLEELRGRYDKVEEVLLPSACAALYSKRMLDEIGLFDRDFFAYCEDTDLGLRARLSGWKCLYVPKAVVYHSYSGTGGRYSERKAFLVERNRLWVAIKNYPLKDLLLLPLFNSIRYVLQTYGALAKKGSAGRFVEGVSILRLILVTLRAWLSFFSYLPSMINKRRFIYSTKKISNKDFSYILKRFSMSGREIALKD